MATRQVTLFALWWGLAVPPYIAVLVLFFIRRTRQPIKARSPLLLLCSAVSGFVLLGYMASRNLLDKDLPCPTTYYLGVILFVLIIVPYLLRCYRLMGIFDLSVAKATMVPEASMSMIQIPPPSSTSSSPLRPLAGTATLSRPSSDGFLTTTPKTLPATMSSPTLRHTPTQDGLPYRAPTTWDFKDIVKKRAKFQEPRLLKILGVILAGLIVILVIIHASLSQSHLKAGTMECEETEGRVVLAVICLVMGMVIQFMVLIYKMRHITDGFSINNELKIVCAIACVHVVFAVWLQASDYRWPAQPFVGYITGSLVLCCIIVSVMWPLLQSFSRVKADPRYEMPAGLPTISSTGVVVQNEFIDFLVDPVARQWFQEFLINEFSVENVLFWNEVQDYKKIANPEDINTVATRIFEQYIVEGSPFQVNLSHECVTHTRELLSSALDTKIFSVAEEEVLDLMKEAYPRFQHSPFGIKLRKELNNKNFDLHAATAAQLI